LPIFGVPGVARDGRARPSRRAAREADPPVVRPELPTFQQLMLPLLQALCPRHEEIDVATLEDVVAKALRLSAHERGRMLPSGNRTVFGNRLNWARSYLAKAGLIELPRRGYCRATDRGRELLAEGIDSIDLAMLDRYPEFAAWRSHRATPDRIAFEPPLVNPEEALASTLELLNTDLARQIVDRVHAFSPAFFERLIIDLLLKMGYGGGRSETARAIGRVGDGGVDGVINQDALGLDVVYVQAKRFDPEFGVPLREVRDFVGGLEGHRATKGVFVTTSYFPSTAYDFVARVTKRVALIDGPALAALMIRHRVGVRVKDTYELKKIDEDYFVE
jgi:restriction system protein